MANPLRKTMVYLGLADEEYDDVAPAAPIHHQAAAPSPAPAAETAAPQAGRAPVTPLRRPQATRPVAAPAMNEILTVHPREYRDAQGIAESFREGVPVIINLSQMTESEARRLIDFASGLSQGLFGRIERVTSKVFLLSPEHIATNGEESEIDAVVDAAFPSA